MEGYIKLFRSMLDWEWWDDHNTTRIWLYILMAASFTESKWHGVPVLPGQLITSYESLAKSSGLSIQSVRSSLNKLKSTGEITSTSTSKYTVVTIANWSKYQVESNLPTGKTTSESTDEQQAINIVPTSNQQHRNNVKKEKKEIQVYAPDSNPYTGAKYLDDALCKLLEGRKPSTEATLQQWAKSFDLLNRANGYDWETIGSVLQSLLDPEDPQYKRFDFWRKNILSGKTFRDKFEKLYAQKLGK